MTNPDAEPPRLSPSEEFAQAHPDFVQSTASQRDLDPNARRAAQLEGAGGGLAAGVNGKLANGVSDSEFDANTDHASERTVEDTEEIELARSKVGLQHRLPRDTRIRGLGHVARIREEMATRREEKDKDIT